MKSTTIIPDTIDFGKVNSGEKLEMRFNIINIGNDTLVFSRVWTSCGCDGVSGEWYQKKYLLPNDSLELTYFFINQGSRIGKYQEYVHINSNAINKPYLYIVTKVQIIEKRTDK